MSKATLEHIVPKHHGGDNRLHNLAIACERCNGQKGRRHDHRRWSDPGLQRLIDWLKNERRTRWREPCPSIVNAPIPPELQPDRELLHGD